MVMAAPIKITEKEHLEKVLVLSYEAYTTTTSADEVMAAASATIVLMPDKDALELLEAAEAAAFSALSEESFAEDWNSPADAIYDTL